jgi:carboxymethylenebutenolidase
VRRSILTAVVTTVVIAGAAPVSAQRIDTTLVRLPTGTTCYVAWPYGKGKAPGMVVLGDEVGPSSQARTVGRRLAAEGYVAVVPDLSPRDGTARIEAISIDVSRALDWFATQPRVQANRVGVIGFGVGGKVALDGATREPRLRAVVMFYGAPITDAGRLATLKAPVLAHFGQLDDDISDDQVNQFRSAMSTAGKPAEIHVYPGAGHAFMNDAGPALHPESARRAWARTLAFLQKTVHD